MKIGLYSDLHFGSIYSAKKEFKRYLKWCNEVEKVDCFICAGDILEGAGMRQGHEHECEDNSFDGQLDIAIATYGAQEVMHYFVTGNHDHVFRKKAGIHVAKEISRAMPFMEHIGSHNIPLEGIVTLTDNTNDVTIKVLHPDGSPGVNASNRTRKFGDKETRDAPDIYIVGHDHHAMWQLDRDIHFIKASCFQKYNQFAAGKQFGNVVGGYVVELTFKKNGSIDIFNMKYKDLK